MSETRERHELQTEVRQLPGPHDPERDRTDPALEEYAELLDGQAILAEGGQLADPAAFGKRVADLLLRVL